jgi:CHAT domain-containing protein/tetratricopeptide (TPR) repeat protein
VCVPGIAQTPSTDKPPGSIPADKALKPGILVEKVDEGYQASRAGIHKGDVLLSWKQGDASGVFDSPFDFMRLDLNRRPLGLVTLLGLRGKEEHSWALAPTLWGVTTEPHFFPHDCALLNEAAQKSCKESSLRRIAKAPETMSAVPWLRAWFLMHSATQFAKEMRWKDAKDAYTQAFAAASELPYDVRSFILGEWGNSALAQSDWAAARDCFVRAMAEENKTGGEGPSTAELLRRLGRVEAFLRNWQAADDYLQRALRLQERLGAADVGATLNELGDTSFHLGDWAAANDYMLQGAAAHRKIDPDSMETAWSYRRLGGMAFYNGDLVDTENYTRQAIKIQSSLNPRSRSYDLHMLGVVAWYRGDFNSAERLVKESLRITKEAARDYSGSRAQYNTFFAGYLITLGIVTRSQGKLDEAERYLKQALSILGNDNPDMSADALDNLGSVYKKRGQLILAERDYRLAVARYQKNWPNGILLADKVIDLARLALLRGDLEQAQQHYDRARLILEKAAPTNIRHPEVLATLGGIARRQGRVDQAKDYYERALRVLERNTSQLGGSDDARARFRAEHEDYYRQYCDLLLSQNEPESAFAVLERSRARALLETLTTAHVDIRTGVDPELIRKGRSLAADFKAKSDRRVRLLSEKAGDEQIKAVEREISVISSEYQDVEALIRSNSPAYAALTQPQPLSTQEIQQQLLDPDTLLLEYSLGEERSYVFVVSTNSLEAFDLPKRAVIEVASRRVYRLLTARNRRNHGEKPAQWTARIAGADTEFPQAVARLSQMVLGPIAGKLQRKRLLIVADGALHYVPFAALPVRVPGKTTLPLVAEHEIVNLPSASVLAVLRRERMGRPLAQKTVAVLADPVFDRRDSRVRPNGVDEVHDAREVTPGSRDAQAVAGAPGAGASPGGNEALDKDTNDSAALDESLLPSQLTRSATDAGWRRAGRGDVYLPRLQSTRREAEAIVAVTPPGQSFEALDFRANRTTATSAELTNYRIVHFATHALLDSKHPELSGLVLSLVDGRGRPRSGFLGLEDIYNLNLPAELVVLSACETALGKGIEGEGMVGLTRGFMYAGASRVMASLWKIDDRATADQMRYFYRAMIGQGLRPAAALRAAQLKMRKDPRWSSPYFWAAFQIQGEWK